MKSTDKTQKLELLLSIASEIGVNIFKLVHVRNMIMAKELKHQIGGLLEAQDSAGRTVKYIIREETTPIWQLIGLNSGDEKRLELFLKKLSKAKGGIFFGVFRNSELIRVERAPADLVVSELRDQFNRPRPFKKRTPRSRVNLSIGKNFLAQHENVELVFSPETSSIPRYTSTKRRK